MEDKYERLKEIINESKSIVVFTGAGISTPSGIPDFRSANGIYNSKGYKVTPENIVSHTYFEYYPEEFFKFYKEKMMFLTAKPNRAHQYFADLEKTTNKRIIVVTQNIDGLHQLAGNKRVLELHGSIHRNYCTKCNKFYDASYIYNSYDVPRCEKCGGIIKPDVVLYEEPLDENVIRDTISALETSETLIVIGTSLKVYPAASFLYYFRGKNIILINKSSTDYDANADLVFNEDIIDVINKIS